MIGLYHSHPLTMLMGDLRADPQDVSVGVADMHLSYVPWLVLWSGDDVDPLTGASRMYRVDVVEPQREPDPMLATSSLSIQAEEDLTTLRRDGAKGRRVGVGWTPVPPLLPAELREPLEAGLEIRYVENRSDFHGIILRRDTDSDSERAGAGTQAGAREQRYPRPQHLAMPRHDEYEGE